MKDFHELNCYKNSKKLYPIIVKVTEDYPHKGYALGDQTRRAVNSIHACVAEGWGRSVAEFKNYLTRALGSNNEVISHLEDAEAVKYLKPETAYALIRKYTVVGKQIYQLREKWH